MYRINLTANSFRSHRSNSILSLTRNRRRHSDPRIIIFILDGSRRNYSCACLWVRSRVEVGLAISLASHIWVGVIRIWIGVSIHVDVVVGVGRLVVGITVSLLQHGFEVGVFGSRPLDRLVPSWPWVVSLQLVVDFVDVAGLEKASTEVGNMPSWTCKSQKLQGVEVCFSTVFRDSGGSSDSHAYQKLPHSNWKCKLWDFKNWKAKKSGNCEPTTSTLIRKLKGATISRSLQMKKSVLAL